MSEKRPPRAMGQLSATDPTQQVGTTIVGGQPPGEGRQGILVSAGVERVLFLAAVDPAFCEELVRDRAAAARRGFKLSESELAVLRLIPAEQLRATIDSLDASPDNLRRRRFLQAVAVGAAAVAAGCSDDDVKTDAPVSGPDATGILADMPPGPDSAGIDSGPVVDIEAPDSGSAVKGIRPDDGGGDY